MNSMTSPICVRSNYSGYRFLHQRGIALVIALIFLLVLTILGVTVMSTASLEGRMAGNTQETNRAFQGAESALNHVLTDGTVFNNLTKIGDVAPTQTVPYPSTTVKVDVTYSSQRSPPPRSRDRANVNSAITYGAAIFDMQSVADTTSLANTKLLEGVSQIMPKNQ